MRSVVKLAVVFMLVFMLTVPVIAGKGLSSTDCLKTFTPSGWICGD